ncbi:YggS family pyridoxal phosphate-dependent enzyme [Bacteroidota bacterium]
MINIENLKKIKEEIGQEVKLIAVSKKQPDEKVREILDLGHAILGENYVQNMQKRYEQFSSEPIEWHMIGHLQSNKVKYIAHFVNMIHGVDSYKLLEFINKEALKNNRVIDCLLQVHIAQEESKFGLDESEVRQILDMPDLYTLKNIRLCGFMGMATFTDDMSKVRKEFSYLRKLFDQIKQNYFSQQSCFSEISMGMSDDYQIAVEEGSTMVRIGTAIFGQRTY